MKKTQRKQLDEIFREAYAYPAFEAPSKGWLRAIRESLGMPLRTLAERVGTSPQAIQQIEKREANQSITLASLRSAAESLDCVLLYAIVPKRPLQETIRTAAEQAADTILSGAAQTMELEDQTVRKAPMETTREELILELEKNPRLLWRWVK